MQKLLTENQKIGKSEYLIQRDGNRCVFVNHELDPKDCEIEHLDNNPSNNENWNLALTCHKHNCEKKDNSDFQIIAQEKIKQNKSQIFIQKLEDHSPREASTEIQININSRQIAEQFITERVQADGHTDYDDALNSITFKCQKQTGHGSQQSTRNYIASLTCSIAPFMIIKNDEGKKIIVKRTGN